MGLSLELPPVYVPQPTSSSMSAVELEKYFSARLNLDVVSALREVVLAAHTDYMLESKKAVGAEHLALHLVQGMKLGGHKGLNGTPDGVWLSVARLPAQVAEALRSKIDDKLRDAIKGRR